MCEMREMEEKKTLRVGWIGGKKQREEIGKNQTTTK